MKKTLLALSALLVPVFTFAQTTLPEKGLDDGIDDLSDIISFIVGLINTAIPIIIALAVLVFIWGVFLFVVKDTDEDKSKGKSFMIWGIIGIFVMVSVWGLVNILDNTFDLDTSAPDNIDDLLPTEVDQIED